ncbi:MAG: hypothetical protein ACRC33_21055 [Gemmataceae bacterium]
MAVKPFDTSLKELIKADPLGWASRFCGPDVVDATVVDGDVATAAAAADKVIRVTQPGGESVLNVEAQSGHDAGIPERLLLYSTVLSGRHEMPVRSVLILLRPEADGPALGGTLRKYHRPPAQRVPDEVPYLVFRYEVVRLWETSAESLLTGPAALVPLAPITDAAAADLQGTVNRAVTRLRGASDGVPVDKMEAAMFLLLGLRYDAVTVAALFQGVQEMENSSTYQLILRRGEARGLVRGAREVVVVLGRKRFGEPGADTVSALERIEDAARLTALAERVYEVSSWQELLA